MIKGLEKASQLLILLKSVASGEEMSLHSNDYKTIRLELISNDQTKILLPDFIYSCRTINDFWDYIQPQFSTYKERRNYLRDQFNPLLKHLEQGPIYFSPHNVAISNSLKDLNCESANYLWNKALARTEDDPDGAITAARSLIESVCKQILVERKISYDESTDLPKLFKLTARNLKLAPELHNDEILKQILCGVQTTVHGFSSLRNKFSDAHGRPNGSYRASKRHAEFAVNLAGTTATFLIDTHLSTLFSSMAN